MLLSIIIPAYNMENYLEKDLNTLVLPPELMQKIEIIIVNDGSTDKTSEIAHAFENEYNESVRVIDKRNGHYGSCINAGLHAATGTYVKILDADDSFDTDHLCAFVTELERSELNHENVDIFFTDYCTVDEEGKLIRSYKYKLPPYRVICVNDSDDRIFNNIQHHAITYRRSLLIENNYHQSEGILYTDQEWITVPLLYVKKLKYIPLKLYKYLLGRDGQSMDKSVISKSTYTHIKLGENMVQAWLSAKNLSDQANINIVKKRLVLYYAYVYWMFLVKYSCNESQELLREADEALLKMSPELYNEVGNHRFSKALPIRYIKAWRKNSQSQIVKLLSKL